MKFTLKFFKYAGTFLMVLGIVMLGSFTKINSHEDYEVLLRCAGACIFIVGGTSLVYANEKESHDQDQQQDNTY